jgi:hypothetical protein
MLVRVIKCNQTLLKLENFGGGALGSRISTNIPDSCIRFCSFVVNNGHDSDCTTDAA